ncbi:MAG: RHS repeat-associated core domain-containing protein [Caldilineaceae bacterium]
MYYYGARWYDPALGRFVQPDTIVPDPGEAKAFDRYAYVLNNPLRYVDPTATIAAMRSSSTSVVKRMIGPV